MSLEGLLKPVHLVILPSPTPASQEALGSSFLEKLDLRDCSSAERQNAKAKKKKKSDCLLPRMVHN